MKSRASLLEGKAERPSQPPLPLAGLKPIHCTAQTCQDFEKACRREWLITNGIGGYASSTVIGMNHRRGHGLLVVAMRPPVARVLLLSKVEETLIAPSGRWELSTNRYAGVVHPEGFRHLVEFRLDPYPTFLYQIGSILLEKSVFMLPREDATVIGYSLHAAPGPVELAVRPLLAGRSIDGLIRESDTPAIRVEESPGALRFLFREELPPLLIHHNAELVELSACWYKNFEYTEDLEKGVADQEDLWSFGQMRYILKPGESCALVASTGRRGGAELIFHQRRLENTQTVLAQTMTPPGKGPLTNRLSWTADGFLAASSDERLEIIAGFPGLAPWGRDTLISLPGLLLSTRRFPEARAVLETLASSLKDGLIPVRFSEEEGLPEYDSADTSLWFFWAVWHYWKASRDFSFVVKICLPVMQEIIEAYLEGTLFGIGMDEDGLIQLSEQETPLTWMDAREPSTQRGLPGRPITPRFGKPVEVNALWYCALNVMAAIEERRGGRKAATLVRLMRLVEDCFLRTFVSPAGFLFDVVSGQEADASIRPNMLIAASLPFSPISKIQAVRLLEVVEEHLLTPRGIRTLSPSDPRYKGQYIGDLKQKSHAYHQGTIWGWLIGPYVSTVLRARALTQATQQSLRQRLSQFLSSLEEGCLGSIPELFDADPPHAPRGSISQGWSVGELLRALHEAKLGDL